MISIGEDAFLMRQGLEECPGLKSITIPNGVKTIGRGAFSGCTGLTSITIPSSVTSIGNAAFSSCVGMTSINVDNGNSAYASVDGVLFNKVKDTLLQCPGGKQGMYTIPSSVKTILQGAFYNCSALTSVTIQNGMTSIKSGAFYGCFGMTSVTIPSSVRYIGEGTFDDCSRLTSVISLNPVPPVVESGDKGMTIQYIQDNDVPKVITLYVPKSGVNAYKQAPGWRVFNKILPIEK